MTEKNNTILKVGDEVSEKEKEQGRRNAANSIHQKISTWVEDEREKALRRWIWELTQNAVDTIQKGDIEKVDIKITFQKDKIIYQHNGGVFDTQELSAIIMGGTTKIFLKKKEYIGRFGSGFLVSHILSKNVEVNGIVFSERLKKNCEFKFLLEREGDINEIYDNINKCYEQLNSQSQVYDNDSSISGAKYIYSLKSESDLEEIINKSLESFKTYIPYVLSFTPKINSITIKQNSKEITWKLKNRREIIGFNAEFSEETNYKIDLIKIESRIKKRKKPIFSHIILISINTENQNNIELAIPVNVNRNNIKIEKLNNNVSKIFRNFPLIGRTEKIPVPFIINSSFEPTPDRDTIFLQGESKKVESNKMLLSETFEIIPDLIECLRDKGFENIHHLCNYKQVPLDYYDNDVVNFWNNQLCNLIISLTDCNIIKINNEEYTNLSEIEFKIPIPYIKVEDLNLNQYDFTTQEYHTFMNLVKSFYSIPSEDVIESWFKILRNWITLLEITGYEVNKDSLYEMLLSLENLASTLESYNDIEELLLDYAKEYQSEEEFISNWLVKFYPLLINYDTSNESIGILNLRRIIIDQNGCFRKSNQLNIDRDIPDTLKDISKSIEYDVRDSLLNNIIYTLHNDYFDNLISSELTDLDIVNELIYKYLGFEANTNLEDIDETCVTENINLLCWLIFTNKKILKENFNEIMPKYPFFNKKNQIVYWSKEGQPILIGLVDFNEVEEYLPLLTQKRIISERYKEVINDDEKYEFIIKYLEKNRIVYDGIITKKKDFTIKSDNLLYYLENPYELEDDDLDDENDGVNHKIEKVSVSIIPFLDKMTRGLRNDLERAKKFFEFIMDYVIEVDRNWQNSVDVECNCGKTHKIYATDWLRILKTHTWIRMFDDKQEEEVNYNADENGLRKLLGDKKINEYINDEVKAEFLKHFRFDLISMTIERYSEGSKQKAWELKKRFEKCVDSEAKLQLINVISDYNEEETETLNEFIEKHKKYKEMGRKNQRLGIKLEEALRELFTKDFEVEINFKGYDFSAFLKGDIESGDICEFEIIEKNKKWLFYVEVKSTRIDAVKLSHAQAIKSIEEIENYIICIIDIKDVQDDFKDEEIDLTKFKNIYIIENFGELIKNIDVKKIIPELENIEVIFSEKINYLIKRNFWIGKLRLNEWIDNLKKKSLKP